MPLGLPALPRVGQTLIGALYPLENIFDTFHAACKQKLLLSGFKHFSFIKPQTDNELLHFYARCVLLCKNINSAFQLYQRNQPIRVCQVSLVRLVLLHVQFMLKYSTETLANK
jgi:hypothetical protein